MIDPKSVVTQVKQGNYPSDWDVYHGQRNYGCVNVLWAFAIGCGVLCLPFLLLEITYAGLFAFLAAFCIILALAFRSIINSTEQSILVLLPEGVVQCDANDPGNIGWLYYPNIDRIELAQQTEVVGFDGDINSRTYYWLDLYCSDGTYLKWGINTCFGDTASIGKTIITAYNYYWRQNSFFHL